MDQNAEKKKTRFSKFWKRYSTVIYLILIIGVTALVILTQVDLKEFLNTIQQAKVGFLLIGIGCIFLYCICEAYILLKLMKRENPKEKFSFAFTLTIVGQYYNLIDPISTGGQPVQLYEMKKEGMALEPVRLFFFKNLLCIR